MDQEFEWTQAQKIEISVDLINAAKRHLEFLCAVDQNRHLYEGPALERAIYRYNACWLPLLAQHSGNPMTMGPLVVPLECEWVWHCHRLNPVQYKSDCEKQYGRILDNSNVISSVQGTWGRETEQLWNKLYPEEPFNVNLNEPFQEDLSEKLSRLEKYTKYDLISAVKRQSPFFYQVSRPHMDNDLFLEEALARYKGFLHLIKINREKSRKCFCVPTYDIDLIWHTHQLHPVSYCKDLNNILGKVLEHDDMDSDRGKGKKLDAGFSGTTKQWEETFGRRYWRAGAMYRGSAPSPLTTIPFLSNMMNKEVVATKDYQKLIPLAELKVVEVLLEFVEVRNLPEVQKGSLFVAFSKKQPDAFYRAKQKLSILSESGEKQVATFQCEPTGELLFELICYKSSNLPITRTSSTLGSSSLALPDFLDPASKLSIEKWLELVPSSGCVSPKPIGLRVAVSFTVPHVAPREFQIVRTRDLSKCHCFLSLPGMIQCGKSVTRVINEEGSEVISLQIRDPKKENLSENDIINKEVIGIMESGESHILSEFVGGSRWSLMDSQWLLHLRMESSKDTHLFELVGTRLVKLFQGRKLDYETKHYGKPSSEKGFMTAVEFSEKDPYGKAVALFDLKSESVKVKEEWMVLPAITTAFILAHILKKEGYDSLFGNTGKLKRDTGTEKVCLLHKVSNNANVTASSIATKDELKLDVPKGNAVVPVKGGGCGGCGAGGCGSGCGYMVKSGGCGGCGAGGCGSGCGYIVKRGGCGGCGAGGCGGCGAGGCGTKTSNAKRG